MGITARAARLVGGIAATGLGLTLLVAAPAAASASPRLAAAPVDKVTICHRDENVKKPYGPKAIEVSVDSIVGPNGHATHTGPVFQAGMDSGWGDIIPSFEYQDGQDVKTFPGLNWDATGQAIWDNDCAIPPAPPVTSTVTTTSTVTRTTATTSTTTSTVTTTITPPPVTTTIIITDPPSTVTTTVTPPPVTTTITTTVPTTVTNTVTTAVPTTYTTVITKPGKTVTNYVPVPTVTTSYVPAPTTQGPPSAQAHTGQDGYGPLPFIALGSGLLLLVSGLWRRGTRAH